MIETSIQKKQKLLENLINIDPNFHIKTNIKAIEEQVKQRNKNRILLSTLSVQEKVLFKH